VRAALVDTDVLIDVLRGNDAARDRLRKELTAWRVYGSVVTRAEVLGGMRPGEEEGTLAQLRAVRWLQLDQRIADRAGDLARAHRRDAPGIGLPDYLIAATVEVLGLRLLTRNVRHFPMFRRLHAAY
jgi:predicted nucleic acid-binding protein